MKSVLISIQPKWVEKIANGEKTIEVRKTAPKCAVPFKCYIYCTSSDVHSALVVGDGNAKLIHCCNYKSAITVGGVIGNGKVIGEFICDKVDEYNFHEGLTEFNSMGLPLRIYGSYLIFADDYKAMCLSYDEVKNYGNGKPLYGLHISDLKIYDKPRELSEFYYCCKEMKANEPRAGKYVSLSCYACRHNALKRTEDYSEYNNMFGYICKRNITRPPQSWCYVEEL